MLINFCQEYLQTSVSCDTINTEGYEIENLLRNNEKGFLAYSCIKPPINIDFNFACWIKISHIIIWPTIGGQKSSGFRLSTKSRASAEYTQIGIGFLNENHNDGIIFCQTESEQTLIKPDKFFFTIISVQKKGVIDRVKSLRLSIIKTLNSVPALKKIEIWGKLSSLNSDKVFRQISQLFSSHNNQQTQQKFCEPKLVHEKIDEVITRHSSSLVIPEEFIDPITCSIMQQPVILPSGKVIDQKTLDNYEKNEASWGRKLSDPFTGIPFNEFNKQIFAASLKSQIDKFLSENCNNEEVRCMPRTLGYSGVSGMNRNEFILGKKNSTKTGSILPNKKRQNETVGESCSAKYSKVECVEKLLVAESFNNESFTKKDSTFDPSLSGGLFMNGNDVSIDGNLENNLKTVLSRLKKFSGEEISSAESSSTYLKNQISCTCCEISIFYKFPCDHIVCRKVLLSNKNFHCVVCDISYKSEQLEKINV